MKEYDVFGVGNSLMDIQVFVPEKFLKKLKISKGVMTLIDEKKLKQILNEIGNYKTTSLPGGDCANAISTIAFLGGNRFMWALLSMIFMAGFMNQKLLKEA